MESGPAEEGTRRLAVLRQVEATQEATHCCSDGPTPSAPVEGGCRSVDEGGKSLGRAEVKGRSPASGPGIGFVKL